MTTIPELIEKCEAAGGNQQDVDAANDHVFEAVVVTDKQGGNTTALNLQLMTEGATTAGNGITLYGSGVYTDPSDYNFTFVAGDKVRVTLKAGEARVTTYSGLHEITGSKNAAWVVIEKIGTATVTPVEITPDQIVAFQAMPVTIKNVTAPAAATWAGTKTFKVNGETDLTIYTQNGAPWAEQEFVGGATGDITGYAALYKGAPQIAPRNINDIAAFMGEPSTDPSITVNPTSLTFAAAGEAKTVTVTKKNADDCTIEASADNEQFTVEVSGDQVNVTAKENTAEEAISGTLTVKLMKAGEAVATATVKLTQSGVSSGNEQTVTLSFAGGDAQNHDEIPFSEGVISAVFAKGSHNTAPRWDADCVRFYGTSGQKNILTVSGATITKVVFNLNGSYTMEGMTADSGSFSDNVWTGSSSSVVFTAGDKQTRIDGITVTYAE